MSVIARPCTLKPCKLSHMHGQRGTVCCLVVYGMRMATRVSSGEQRSIARNYIVQKSSQKQGSAEAGQGRSGQGRSRAGQKQGRPVQ